MTENVWTLVIVSGTVIGVIGLCGLLGYLTRNKKFLYKDDTYNSTWASSHQVSNDVKQLRYYADRAYTNEIANRTKPE